MDPSYRSPNPHEPPKDWTNKFYRDLEKKTRRGKFYSVFRIRNERRFAMGLGIFCVCFYFFPMAKAVVKDAINCYNHPELINIFGATMTKEEKEAFRRKQAHVSSVYDLWK